MLQREFKLETKYPKNYALIAKRLALHQGLPYTRLWSAADDFLNLLIDHCMQYQPEHIVECGSGLSTLVLAKCCAINARGHVYSLESGAKYAQASRDALALYGLTDVASVLDTPLVDTPVDGQTYQWYALDRLDAPSIDLLVIDGPPGFIQHHSRYPALPLLADRLSEDGMIYLDDAARKDERELVQRWQAHYPAMQYRFIETRRGCAVVSGLSVKVCA